MKSDTRSRHNHNMVSTPVLIALFLAVAVTGATATPALRRRTASIGKVPWVERFARPDGTKNTTGAVSWTAERTGGIFEVQNRTFVIEGAGSEGVLTTTPIDISQGPVDVSVEVYSKGSLEVKNDNVKLYIRVDDQEETLLGKITGIQEASTLISGTNIRGSKLVVIVRANVSWKKEYYFLDNLSVLPTNKTPAPVHPPVSPPVSQATTSTPVHPPVSPPITQAPAPAPVHPPVSPPVSQATTSAPVKSPVSQPYSPSCLYFILIDAITDKKVGVIKNGTTINLGIVGLNLNVLVSPSFPVRIGSIAFEYDGQFRKFENNNPFTFAANTALDYRSWTPDLGSHSMKATIWSAAGGTGSLVCSETVSFDVVA